MWCKFYGGAMGRNSRRATQDGINQAEKALKNKNWTQPKQRLAAEVGCGPNTISNFFGRTKIDNRFFKGICTALGLDEKEIEEKEISECSNQPQFKGELSNFQALFDRKLKRFVGRGFVFDAIEEFFSINSNGYFTIVAEPGMGKSTILAKYISDKNCVGHFFIRAGGKNKIDQFLRSVCNQLIERYDLGYASLPDRATNDGEFLDELLHKASRLLPPGERLVIAVDALDEVENNNEYVTNICYLPRYLPDNVYFLLTRRPFTSEEERLFVEAPTHNFNLWQYDKESKADMKEYIQLFLVDPEFGDGLQRWIKNINISQEQFINRLVEKSKNNFMYLRHVLPEIAKPNGIYKNRDSIQGLPEGLERYYEEHWAVMGMNTKQKREKVIIICILLKLSEKVSCELIADIAKPDIKDISEVQELLDDWYEFFDQEELEEQTCYSIYHLSYVEFLEKRLEEKKLTVTRQEINNRILDYFDKEMDEDE